MPRNIAQAAKIRARRLRRKMTLPERLLWGAMRNRNFGYRVRRQHPIGNFTLDFFIAEAMICIEIDGKGHELKEEYDHFRDKELATVGITTIRVSAAAVLRNAHEVGYSIKMSLHERASESGKQTPSLSTPPTSLP